MPLHSKTVLITGASAGLGAATAALLLEQDGWTVYAAARRTERMQDLAANGAKVLAMDVTDSASVDAGVQQIIAAEGRIDAVLANAGYGVYGPIESVAMEDILRQYEVNVFGVARTLKAVLPHMRRQRSGRIVLTASVVSHISIAIAGWYSSTKHALAAIAKSLRQEVRDLGIDVVQIEPGAVKTDFDEVAFETFDRTDHPEDYDTLTRGFRRGMSNLYVKAPGPEGTARAMVRAITAKRPRPVYRTTSDAKLLPKVQSLLSRRAFDALFLKQMKKAAQQPPESPIVDD